MDYNKLSFNELKEIPFNARLGMLKFYVGENMKDAEQDLTTNKNKGYFPIKSIMNVARPLLLHFQINLTTELNENGTLIGIFIDWWSNETTTIKLHAKEALPQIQQKKGNCDDKYLKNCNIDETSYKLLPSMANAPQNLGAIFTYLRRYLLTNMFDLQAVDIIENSSSNNISNSSNNNSSSSSNSSNNLLVETEWKDLEQLKDERTKEIAIIFKKMLGDNIKTSQDKLKEYTIFKNKDGKEYYCNSFIKLDEKNKPNGWLSKVYERMKKEYKQEFYTRFPKYVTKTPNIKDNF